MLGHNAAPGARPGGGYWPNRGARLAACSTPAEPLASLLNRPVPISKNCQRVLELCHIMQPVHGPGTRADTICTRKCSDHPGGEHVVRDLQCQCMLEEPQHRFMEKPVLQLEARAEGTLADEHPHCPAHSVVISCSLEVALQLCSCWKGEFLPNAVPDVTRDSRPEALSQHTRRSRHGRLSRWPSANGGGPGSRSSK